MAVKRTTTKKDRLQTSDKGSKDVPTEVDGTRAPKKTSPIVGSGILHTPPVCLSLQGATERAGRGRAHTDLKIS